MRAWAREIGRWLGHGLPALAVYALVLQAFLTGAAPAAPFDASRTPLCSEMAAGAGHPAPADAPVHHQHDCLCFAQCAAPFALAVLPGAAAPASQRVGLLAAFAPGRDAAGSLSPLQRGPGARAPPRG